MQGASSRVPAPQLPAGPRSALVVATTTYQDAQLRQLRAPATDAVELAAVLADPAIGGFTVASVVDQPLHDVMVTLEEFLTARRPDELVVVYLSCHGITDPRGRLYFATKDTIKARVASTALDSQWVNDRMDECRARRQVLVLDCCFSGAFARGAKGDGAVGLDPLAEPGRGRVVLTASNAREYSFESPDSTPAPESPAPGSVFTAALVAGLREGEADVDGDGYITVDEAYAYAYQRVRASGVAQTPQRWLSGGEGQLVLARNRAGTPVVAAPLPESIHSALDNPLPAVRIAPVRELGGWLTSADPARISTATTELQKVISNDILSVARHARETLASLARVPPSGAGVAEPPGRAPARGLVELPTEPSGADEPPIPGSGRGSVRRRRTITLGAGAVLLAGVLVLALDTLVPFAGPGDGDATVLGSAPGSLPSSEPLDGAELVVAKQVGEDDFDLFLADAGKPGPDRRLTDRPGSDSAPVLSPDRRTLVYLHSDDGSAPSLRVAGAADLSGDRALFALPPGCLTILRPAWNPKDAGMVAVGCRDDERRTTMRLFRTDGTLVRIVDPPAGTRTTGHLAFSTNGERLGFWASEDRDANDGRLYTVSVLGGTPAAVFPDDASAEHDASLAFSPDGKHVSFARLVDNHFDVMVADAGGTEVLLLTSGSQRDDEPSWSPDSRRIAFRSAAATPLWPGAPVSRIWIVSSSQGEPRLLWPEGAPEQQRSPAWS